MDCPPTKRRKVNVDELFGPLKEMEPGAQLELWKEMISRHPFDLDQLRSLRTAIDDRIKLDIISAVPYEIALYIISFLSPQDLCQAAQTCRSWRVVCEDNRLWREKAKEEGILNDKLRLDYLFKKRIADSHCKQEKFVSQFVSAEARVPKSEWKEAYMNHISMLRNWNNISFEIKVPFIAANTNTGEQNSSNNDENASENNNNSSSNDSEDESNVVVNNGGENLTDNDGTIEQQQHLKQLRCHEDSVITCLQYNPRTNIIVSGSDDHTLKVWSSETGRCITTLEGHNGGVWSSQLSPDDIVISGSTDRTLRVWKAHTGELIHTLVGHTSTVRCLALDGKQVVSGSRDATLRLWDIEDGQCLHVFSGHSDAVRCVEFKEDIIVSGSYDHRVMVWDAKAGTCCHSLKRHDNRIYSLQFDGRTIASGSLDCTICIWDAKTGVLRHQLKGHQSLTSKMQLKENLLVSANADSYCKVWDVNTGECLKTLGGENKHTSAITSVYFNDWHIVTSSDDGTVKLWNLKTGEFIRNLIILPTASNGGVVWRIRGSYNNLICAVGSRTQTEDTHLLVLNFSD